jgi:putative thiamine transport system ATP-binding protein
MTLDIHVQRLGFADQALPPLCQDLKLSVQAGQILTLMGPSGSGKSSLLAAIAGTLQSATDEQAASAKLVFDGHIVLNGQDISHWPASHRGVGLLFQDALLFAHMSVAENLLFAVPAGPRAQRWEQVEQALHEAELPDYGDRDPATLSGGQRARIALMRALLAKPRALLLDEPFSKLDVSLRSQFRHFVFEHVRQRRIPAILVTHDVLDVADSDCLLSLNVSPSR